MQRRGSFAEAEYADKKQTRRDKFLGEMERVVPWARLVDRLRPFYSKGQRGRPPIGLERMREKAVFADARLYRADKRPELEDGDICWNIDETQQHQSVTQRLARAGRGGREGAVASAGLGRAPVPHREEPVPAS
jgi:hypothetical protein